MPNFGPPYRFNDSPRWSRHNIFRTSPFRPRNAPGRKTGALAAIESNEQSGMVICRSVEAQPRRGKRQSWPTVSSDRCLTLQGLLNISLPWQTQAQEETAIISWRECSKKSVQQGRESPDVSRRVLHLFDARSVHGVREHGKRATCLRVAASAKAGNAAGSFFQHSLSGDKFRTVSSQWQEFLLVFYS